VRAATSCGTYLLLSWSQVQAVLLLWRECCCCIKQQAHLLSTGVATACTHSSYLCPPFHVRTLQECKYMVR
jgi:hypothetical protein